MKLLIDAEFYLYRLAIMHQEDYEWDEGIISTFVNVENAMQDLTASIVGLVNWVSRTYKARPQQILLCHGDAHRSFRHSLYREYKSNRKKSMRKPVGYREMLGLMRPGLDLPDCHPRHAGALPPLDLLEGDDMIGVSAQAGDIVVGIDKDFATLPFRRLNWQPWEPAWQQDLAIEGSEDAREADLRVFAQALTGDPADGYPGCPKIGPVKAASLLLGASTEREMWDITRKAFLKAGLNEAFALQMVQCARILRPGEYDHGRRMPILWQPPLG